MAAQSLSSKGYEGYLPLYRTRKRWSDRVVETELPLFPGYVFCRFEANERLPILTSPGVVSIVSCGKVPIPIPEGDLGAIQAALESGFGVEPCPFLKQGQRVRLNKGALEGIEGILVREKSEWRIVLSIELLQRSVSVEVDREWVTAL